MFVVFHYFAPRIPVEIMFRFFRRRGVPSIRLWFLLFKTLTVASNLPFEDERMVYRAGNNISVIQNTIGTTETIIQHERFSDLITEFLSSPFVDDMVRDLSYAAERNTKKSLDFLASMVNSLSIFWRLLR